MKRFTTELKDQAILYAIKRAEELLLPTSLMLAEIRKKNDFQYNSGTGEEIYAKLVQSNRTMVDVRTYRPWYAWSKAVGYYDGIAIYLNSRKVLSHTDLLGLLVHEYCHHAGFSHGNNWPSDHKSNFSVPYWCNKWIEYGTELRPCANK